MNAFNYIRPNPLIPGSCVAITAPSSPVPEEVLNTSVESLKFLGLEPVILDSCRQKHGYLAGKDHQRALDINRGFSDPSIRGIFCLRGGYGAARILPMLDYEMIAKNPKVFVGYSDITALHTAFQNHCNFITFHGPMPNTGYAKMDPFSLKSMKQNLFSSSTAGRVYNPAGEHLQVIYPGIGSGILTGGNLSLLVSTLGSPYEVDTRDKILFIEDVGERPYRLDKAFTALALAGKFKDCAGVILGTFAECEEPPANTVPKNTMIADAALTLTQIIEEVIRPFQKPTILNFRAGHIYPQSTMAMGSKVTINTDYPFIEFHT